MQKNFCTLIFSQIRKNRFCFGLGIAKNDSQIFTRDMQRYQIYFRINQIALFYTPWNAVMRENALEDDQPPRSVS